MPMIRAGENWVETGEPTEEDRFCQIIRFAPGELHGQAHPKAFPYPVEPIENFQKSVDYAVELAGQMVLPVLVLPLTTHEGYVAEDAQAESYSPELRRSLTGMWARVMLENADRDRRQLAFDMLVNMGVVEP